MAFQAVLATMHKCLAAAVQPYIGDALKGSGEGNSSPKADLWAVYSVVYFRWKELWPEIWIHPDLWVVL